MAVINMKNRSIQAKIVYYGPGRGGKTTNLEYIYKKFNNSFKSEMVSIKTHGDRTLFFDFLPFEMGKIGGYDVRIQLYTVPGQVKYNATRQIVLKGVDGVVFVADSRLERREKNMYSLENLRQNLKAHQKEIRDIPLVMQYNKRDLEGEPAGVLDLEEMEKDMNGEYKVPSFPASAINGENVVATLKCIIKKTVSALEQQMR